MLRLVLRYSDFVVNEISKQGKIVHLDDLSVPPEAEVRYLRCVSITSVTSLYGWDDIGFHCVSQ